MGPVHVSGEKVMHLRQIWRQLDRRRQIWLQVHLETLEVRNRNGETQSNRVWKSYSGHYLNLELLKKRRFNFTIFFVCRLCLKQSTFICFLGIFLISPLPKMKSQIYASIKNFMDPLPIDQARRPSTMAGNRRFMNFFTQVGIFSALNLFAWEILLIQKLEIEKN